MTHRFVAGVLTGTVLWGMVVAAWLLWHRSAGLAQAALTPDRAAGGYEMAAVISGRRTMDVFGLFTDEAANVRAQGFTLKPITVDINNPLGWYGRTVICTPTCGDRILLLRDWFWSEEMARAVIAHEIGHLVFQDAGMEQSEEKADLFAACFGTSAARAYANLWFEPAGQCADLSRELKPEP